MLADAKIDRTMYAADGTGASPNPAKEVTAEVFSKKLLGLVLEAHALAQTTQPSLPNMDQEKLEFAMDWIGLSDRNSLGVTPREEKLAFGFFLRHGHLKPGPNAGSHPDSAAIDFGNLMSLRILLREVNRAGF